MADNYVEELLKKWQLDVLIPTFSENLVDEQSFQLLTNYVIKELVPKVGLRLKFITRYRQYCDEINTENEVSIPSTSSSSTITISSDVSESGNVEFDITDNIDASLLFKRPLPFDDNPINEPYVTDLAINNNYSPKRQKLSLFPDGLECLLKKSQDGQIVLMKKDVLDNDCRQKLVKIIIDYLLSPQNQYCTNNRINLDLLAAAAYEITELFPGERAETDYIPYKKSTIRGKTFKLLPRGKLYSKYVNLKKSLREASGCTLEATTVATDSEGSDGESAGQDADDEINDAYNRLIYLTGAGFEEILSDWKKTYNCRQIRLAKVQSAQEYFNLFPVLKLNDGYKLLLEDFNTRFSTKIQNRSIYTIWPQLVPVILELGKEKKIPIPELDWPEARRDNETNLILSFKVLSWLHQPITIRNYLKKRNFRPSKIETLESFLLHIQTVGELDMKIQEKKTKARSNKIGLQPFMVCVGPIDKITAFYVIVDEQKYACENCLMALDLTLKIFFVLNLQYPPECKSVWQTIDQLLYKIESTTDSNSATVLSDIEKKINKK